MSSDFVGTLEVVVYTPRFIANLKQRADEWSHYLVNEYLFKVNQKGNGTISMDVCCKLLTGYSLRWRMKEALPVTVSLRHL